MCGNFIHRFDAIKQLTEASGTQSSNLRVAYTQHTLISLILQNFSFFSFTRYLSRLRPRCVSVSLAPNSFGLHTRKTFFSFRTEISVSVFLDFSAQADAKFSPSECGRFGFCIFFSPLLWRREGERRRNEKKISRFFSSHFAVRCVTKNIFLWFYLLR